MLDVIVTVSETTKKHYVKQCLESVNAAIAHAKFNVNLIVQEGVPGNVGKAMWNGVQKSNSKYIAWVDDDDFVLPNAFSCLESHLTRDYGAIYAREIRHYHNGWILPNPGRHHLTAWHSDIISKTSLLDYHVTPYRHMYDLVGDNCIDELSWVYIYRVYISEAQKLRSKASKGVSTRGRINTT